MSEEGKNIEKKIEKTEQEKAQAIDLSEKDLEQVAGGASTYTPPEKMKGGGTT
jgi:hypothetical protein